MLGQLSYTHFISTIFVEQSFGPELSDSEIGLHALQKPLKSWNYLQV